MATILDKDLQRESTVLANDRNIMVTLGSDQTIKFKLKGMKSGEVSISIEDLWKQLNGIEDTKSEEPKKSLVIETDDEIDQKSSKDNPMIPLYDIRSRLAISLPAEFISKVDPILNEFVIEHKKRVKEEETNKKKKK